MEMPTLEAKAIGKWARRSAGATAHGAARNRAPFFDRSHGERDETGKEPALDLSKGRDTVPRGQSISQSGERKTIPG